MIAHVSPRRYLALWFPFLPTDRIERTRRRGGAPAEPLVLYETAKSALRIAALNRRAIELGLAAGFTLADARARLPDLEAIAREPQAEDALLLRLVEACDRWTPLFAPDPPHGLMLDITGCAHLFGDEAALRLIILRRFRTQGFATRAAIAGTPDAARALSRFGRTAIVPAFADGLGRRERPLRPPPPCGKQGYRIWEKTAGLHLSPVGRGRPAGPGEEAPPFPENPDPPHPPLLRSVDLSPSQVGLSRLGQARVAKSETSDFAGRGVERGRVRQMRSPCCGKGEGGFGKGDVVRRRASPSAPRPEPTAPLTPPRKEEGERRSPYEAAAVRPLPVAALGLDEGTRAALSLAGLKRVSDLLDRPSRPLAARFGEALITKLRRVAGYEDVRITPLRAPPAVRVDTNFAEPVSSTEAIEAALEELIVRAVAVLEARGQGGRTFEAAFFRTDGAMRRVAVSTGRPSRDKRSLMRLFRERLDALADPLDPGFGFDLIRLEAPVTEPLGFAQPGFDRDILGEDGVADLLDRLAARLGPSRVLRFTSADTHDPVRASGLAPALAGPARAVWPEAETGEPPLRPMQIFDPPQPIETLAETPDGPPVRFRWRRALHRVARAEGPERISPEWWRGPAAPTRDYYRVEDEAGRRYWIFRAGLYGPAEAEPRWFLHGLFA